MDKFTLQKLALPAVLCLISFLSFSSQYLFYSIQPGHLDGQEFLIFNTLNASLLFCYARAILTDPGRVPDDWQDTKSERNPKPSNETEGVVDGNKTRSRWCRKCDAAKPPRAHHCKICKRCIPKMDHHCPWTLNCVSHRTFPHFLRFLLYACAAMTYLEYFLYQRGAVIWAERRMPSYLGPSIFQLLHLISLLFTNSLTLFSLGILFIRSIWCLAVNTYTIEGWEIERHETLVRRSRYLGGYLDGPGGVRVKITRQEFPYDIGIWSNLCQGMGTWNVLAWFWPFAKSCPIQEGISWPTNGFEDPKIGWPPVDPDRIPRPTRAFNAQQAFLDPGDDEASTDVRVASFTQRKQADLLRQQGYANATTATSHNIASSEFVRRRKFADRYDSEKVMESDGGQRVPRESEDSSDGSGTFDEQDNQTRRRAVASPDEGEESWRNADGERLDDFGVDEDAEFYDEETIPLAELMRRRKLQAST